MQAEVPAEKSEVWKISNWGGKYIHPRTLQGTHVKSGGKVKGIVENVLHSPRFNWGSHCCFR